MKRKIGILTFNNAINYGAILQEYALYTVLNSNNNIFVEVLNYRCAHFENVYSEQKQRSKKI